MKNVFMNEEAGIRDFMMQINSKFQDNYKRIFGGRTGHAILYPQKNMKNPSFYAIFKRDHYNTFKYEFSDFSNSNPELGSCAESINIGILEFVIDKDLDYIAIVTGVDSITINPRFWLKYSKKNNLIRCQKKINGYFDAEEERMNRVNETTYCLPIEFFKNVNDL